MSDIDHRPKPEDTDSISAPRTMFPPQILLQQPTPPQGKKKKKTSSITTADDDAASLAGSEYSSTASSLAGDRLSRVMGHPGGGGGGGGGSDGASVRDGSHEGRRSLTRDHVPELMRTNSNKRILNQRPLNAPTKKLRMKSLLWMKPTVNSSELTNSTFAQLFPTLIVNLGALSAGLSLGYSAIALPQLKPYMDADGDDGSGHYRPFTLDEETGSWIASIFGLGAIFGGFASGLLGSRLGRRKALLLLVAPDILGWALIASAQNAAMMLAGRLLCGFAAAGYAPSIQVFVAEIAQPHVRGVLAAVTVPTIGLGTLSAYSLGAVCGWHVVAALALIPAVLLAPGLAILHDSPYWYLQQGQEKKALQVMESFRSSDANCLAELLAISESLQRPDDEQHFSYRALFSQMMHRQYRRPFLLLNALFLLMTFSGKFAIGFYAVEIFRHANGGAVDEYLSAIAVGFVKLLGSFVYLPAVRYFSRRALLCGSSLVMGVSLVALGLAVYTHHDGAPPVEVQHMAAASWLPLLCVTAFMLADPLGLGSIPFLYSAEFYPSEMRSFLSGVTAGLANLEMFLAVKTFPSVSLAMGGAHGVFWMYAAVCFAAVVFVLLFLPETKGKSLQDIEGFFARKESQHVTPFATPAPTPSSAKRAMAPYPHMSIQFTL